MWLPLCLLGSLIIGLFASRAQTFSTIHSFGVLTNITGALPYSQLIQGPDGTLYGTTAELEVNYGNTQTGNTYGGTVFKLNSDGSGYAVLKYFTNSWEGANPRAGLLLLGNTLYGTTFSGGATGSGAAGTVFKINIDGSGFATLHTFGGSGDGANSYASLAYSGGTLYGTTVNGGAHGCGTVFGINTNGTGYSLLYSFQGREYPLAGVVAAGGLLYGTGYSGGSANEGVVFQIGTNGTGYTILHSFTNSPDGSYPQAGLVLSGSTLYGTTFNGGTNSGSGTLFSLNTNGTGYAVLYNFALPPLGTLVCSGNCLYGNLSADASADLGAVFRVNTNGTGFTKLYSFPAYTENTFNGTFGIGRAPGLLLSNNIIYGTSVFGGTNAGGMIFTLNTNGGGFAPLFTFKSASDAVNPEAGLVSVGNRLYGTTYFGGAANNGTIYQLGTDGTGGQILYDFNSNFPANGSNPQAGLAFLGGTLYGTTPSWTGDQNGNNPYKTAFSINPNGTGFTVFQDIGNYWAWGISGFAAAGGTLYGTTQEGGTVGAGVVYAVNTNGSGYVVLHNFTNQPDGLFPTKDMILSGGTLFGTTYQGGISNCGTIFSLSTNGTGYTILHSFTNSPDGANPSTKLILSGGTLYGATLNGGGGGPYNQPFGTIFSLNTNGTGYKVLYDFVGDSGASAVGGASPNGLFLSGNHFYGTTLDNGGLYFGAVFQLNTNGSGFTILHTYTNLPDGALPNGDLVLVSNVLYGTTIAGGSLGDGTVFQIGLPVVLPPSLTNQPANVTVATGGNPVLSVAVSGTPPYAYQWYFNGTAVNSATNATLTLTNFSAANVGSYYVAITNASGGIVSQPFTVASVDIHLLATVYVNGPLGSNFLIQAATNLAAGWITLTNVLLPTQPYLYVDYSSLTNQQRFYRAVQP